MTDVQYDGKTIGAGTVTVVQRRDQYAQSGLGSRPSCLGADESSDKRD